MVFNINTQGIFPLNMFCKERELTPDSDTNVIVLLFSYSNISCGFHLFSVLYFASLIVLQEASTGSPGKSGMFSIYSVYCM